MTPDQLKQVFERMIDCGQPVKIEVNYSGNGGAFKAAIKHVDITDSDDAIIPIKNNS